MIAAPVRTQGFREGFTGDVAIDLLDQCIQVVDGHRRVQHRGLAEPLEAQGRPRRGIIAPLQVLEEATQPRPYFSQQRIHEAPPAGDVGAVRARVPPGCPVSQQWL